MKDRRGAATWAWSARDLDPLQRVKLFVERLRVPSGANAGDTFALAPFQSRFIEAFLKPDVSGGALSVGRGNGKTPLAAALALACLFGAFGPARMREIVIAAVTREQASIAFRYALEYLRGSPRLAERVRVRNAARELDYCDGLARLHVISADAAGSLGSSPALAIADEVGAWSAGRGADLFASLETGTGKCAGKLLAISTSPPNDQHFWARWLDVASKERVVHVHAGRPNCDLEDVAELNRANPATAAGFGPCIDRLIAAAADAKARGGSAAASFRNLVLNERVETAGEAERLLEPDELVACEAESPPAKGENDRFIVGLDVGETASLTAAAAVWIEEGKIKADLLCACNANAPTLKERSERDGLDYLAAVERGELVILGDRVVDVDGFVRLLIERWGTPSAVWADRYKRPMVTQVFKDAGVRCRLNFGGQGYRDGGQSVAALRRSVKEGRLEVPKSYLLRSACAGSSLVSDDAGNKKLTKRKSNTRVDVLSALLLAVWRAADFPNELQERDFQYAVCG